MPQTPQAIVDFEDPGIIEIDPDFPCPEFVSRNSERTPIKMCDAESAFFSLNVYKTDCCAFELVM